MAITWRQVCNGTLSDVCEIVEMYEKSFVNYCGIMRCGLSVPVVSAIT